MIARPADRLPRSFPPATRPRPTQFPIPSPTPPLAPPPSAPTPVPGSPASSEVVLELAPDTIFMEMDFEPAKPPVGARIDARFQLKALDLGRYYTVDMVWAIAHREPRAAGEYARAVAHWYRVAYPRLVGEGQGETAEAGVETEETEARQEAGPKVTVVEESAVTGFALL